MGGSKFVSVFSLESFPLYDRLYVLISMYVLCEFCYKKNYSTHHLLANTKQMLAMYVPITCMQQMQIKQAK